jgi:hypothetical protein
LYAAKKAGRNCVWYQNGDECRPAAENSPSPELAQKISPPATASKTNVENAAAPVANALPETSPAVFATDLRRRLLECQEYNVPLSLLFLDVDELPQLTSECGP